MNIIREAPVNEGAVSSFIDIFYGSTDWVFERRLAQCRGNLLSTCDEIEFGNSDREYLRTINDPRREDGRGSVNNSHANSRPVPVDSGLKEEIRKADSWSEIFRLEQSLVNRISDQAVLAELRRRRTELHRFASNLQTHYQYEIKNLIDDVAAKPDAMRELLFRLVKDMQWCELNSFHHHVFVCQLTQRVNVVFTISMIIFFTVIMGC